MSEQKCCNDSDADIFIYENNKSISDYIMKKLNGGGYVEDSMTGGAELTKEKTDSIISKMKKELSGDEIEDPAIILEYLNSKEPNLNKFDKMLIRYIVLKTKNERTKFVNDFIKSNESIYKEIRKLNLDSDIETRKLVRNQSEQWSGPSFNSVVNTSGMSIPEILRSIGFGTRYNTLYSILQAMFLPKIDIFDRLYLQPDLIDVVNKRHNDKDMSDIGQSYSGFILDNLFKNDLSLKDEVKNPYLYVIRVTTLIKKIVYNIRSTNSIFPSTEVVLMLESLLSELDMIDIPLTTSFAVNVYTRLSRVVGLFPIIAIVEKKKGKGAIESYNIIKYNSEYLNSMSKLDRKTLIEQYFKDDTNIKNHRENIFRDITEKDLFISYMGRSSIKEIVNVEGVIPAYTIRENIDSNVDLCSFNYNCPNIDNPTIVKVINTSEQSSTLVSAICYEEQVDLNNGTIIYNDLSVYPLIYLGDNKWLNLSKKALYNKLKETDGELKSISSNLINSNDNIGEIGKMMALFVQRGIDVKSISDFIIADNTAMDLINNRSLIVFYKDNNFSSSNNIGFSCIF